MTQGEKTTMKKRFLTIEVLLVFLCFSVCLAGALLLPVNQCPDEGGRLSLIEWIVKTGTLPTGDEPETMLPGWGFSYALRPFLSSMIGALFSGAASLFTDSPRILLAASRMCSVLSVTLCCFFCLRLGLRLFEKRGSAVLFAVIVCFLPQTQFLGMYHNNDALSLFAVCMMLYYLVEGYDSAWPVKSCVGLAVAFSVGLLSYYSIYGWLLMGALFCVLAVLTDRDTPDKGRFILGRVSLIAGICLLLAGWFFIRNALLHDGDFFGIASEAVSRERAEAQGLVLFPYTRCRDEGMTLLVFLCFKGGAFLKLSVASFVGIFGNMQVLLPALLYGIYGLFLVCVPLFFIAVLRRGRPGRRDGLLMLMMLLSGFITFCLHLWHSYTRDYEPQGRYIITLIVPLAYMLAYSLDKTDAAVPITLPGKRVALHPAVVLTLVWLALFALAALGTMVKMLP